MLFSVIPAEAGIQWLLMRSEGLDPGFHRGDDTLRKHR